MNLLDFLQSASNAAASNVSGPVDLVSGLLNRLGIPVQNAVGGSDWMKQRGLMKDVPQSPSSLAGETFGLLAPIGVAAKAPQIASGLLQAQQNAAIPRELGTQRGVVPVSFVKDQGKTATLPADDTFAQAVANTPGSAVTPDGLLMNIQRRQMSDQGGRESVRGGVFYLPEGASQMKNYTGRNGYGGDERISGQTLIQNPVFVKGATGGKAPESAFDLLKGKGAYQEMRTDALKAYGRWPATKADKAVLADEFLDKYAPEMSGMGHYIVENSTHGNTLAYALQEAAVGSAVRRAGHDAVLGYSKQRTGSPFISEVFDVRERMYPTKFGGFGVWE